MKRVLFIGHEAERTGAPFVLLHLLRWIKENRTDIEIEILLLRDGPIRELYEEVGNVFVIPSTGLPEIVVRGERFLRRRLGVRKKLRTRGITPLANDYDLVVGNTVGSLEYLEFFKKRRGIRTLCWLHEMRSVIESFIPETGRFAELSSSVDRFVVASAAVEAVVREFGVERPVERICEFSELRPVDRSRVASIRSSLGIPENGFVVGGSGTVSSRKGTDLFLQMAEELAAEADDIYFLWVGGPSSHSTREFDDALDTVRRRGLQRVFITGAQTDPENYFANMDVFALTSREDPFPLVCLEAASLGKPVICFADAGGMPDFVGDDAGGVIPFGDTHAFAAQIREYYLDREKLRSAGTAAYRKITTDFSLETCCRRFCDVIDSMI